MTAPITWTESVSPILWSNVGINWNTPAETGSATYAVGDGFTLGIDHTKGVSASFGVESSYSSVGVTTIPASVSFGAEVSTDLQHGIVVQLSGSIGVDSGYSSSIELTMNPAIEFSMSGGFTSIGNMSFSETVTFSGEFTQSALDSLLWNPETDPTTTWTSVSDPSTTWSSVSDPSTTWTKVDYPN